MDTVFCTCSRGYICVVLIARKLFYDASTCLRASIQEKKKKDYISFLSLSYDRIMLIVLFRVYSRARFYGISTIRKKNATYMCKIYVGAANGTHRIACSDKSSLTETKFSKASLTIRLVRTQLFTSKFITLHCLAIAFLFSVFCVHILSCF